MVSAVLDTNVLVSGIVGIERAESTPGAVLRTWARREFDLILSDHIVTEVVRTLEKPYFARRVQPGQIRLLQQLFVERARLVAPAEVAEGVATHPEDDLILATAVAGSADYLVTGDHQLLLLSEYGTVEIVSASEFVGLLTSHA